VPNDTQSQRRPRGTVEFNIHSMAEVERSFEDRRTAVQCVSDSIADFSGTLVFVVVHVLIFAAWFLVNTHKFPGIPQFDPYPFTLLNMLVSVEAVLLSTFVLMKQNRMQRRTDHRDHINLQIGLLAEKEVTKILQLQRLICIKLDIQEAQSDTELDEMTRATSVDHVAQTIRDVIPPSN
jgi:uncharacterized membrane protein